METKKIVMGVISIAVAIIVLMSMIPIFTDAGESEDTFTNEGYYRMSHYDDTTDHTFSWSYESPNVLTVDGEDVVISGVVNKDTTVIADTDWLVRMSTDGSGNVIRLSLVLSSGGTTTASVADSQNVSITLTSGTMAATFGATNKSGTYSDIWIPSNDGNMIMKKAEVDAYINGDSEVLGYGLTRIRNNAGGQTGSPGIGMMFLGTYDDGISGTVWRGADTTTLSDETINAVADPSHIDLYRFSSITAVATLTETVDEQTVTTDTDVTYNYVIVPYEVTAERSAHASPVESTLIGLIPLLMMVGIMLTAIGLFIAKYRNRN